MMITRLALAFLMLVSTALADDVGNADENHSNFPRYQQLMLETREGYFVSADSGGGGDVNADTKNPKTSEIFTAEWQSKDRLRLKTRDGFYIGARMGGGANVDATTDNPGSSEVFTIEWVECEHNCIRLRTRDSHYLHAVRGGGSQLDARVVHPKTSEVFVIRLPKKNHRTKR